MKRRIVAILMAALMAVGLTACGGGGGKGAEGMIDKVDALEIAGFDSAYTPDFANVAQQEGQIDVVILFDGTEKGWEALAKEYERIQGGYVTVKLDTTYTSTSIYTDKLRSEVQGTTNWDIVQGNLLGGDIMSTYCINMSSWITEKNTKSGLQVMPSPRKKRPNLPPLPITKMKSKPAFLLPWNSALQVCVASWQRAFII